MEEIPLHVINGFTSWSELFQIGGPQIFVTAITNTSLIPVSISMFKHGKYYEAICMLSALICSFFYHLYEVPGVLPLKGRDIMGMNAGNWHRLDNVFAILSFSAIMYHIADFSTSKQKELARWGMLTIILYCQERGPWQLINLAVPLALALSIVIIKFIVTRTTPTFNYNLKWGVLSGIIAVVFFIRGLDEDNDFMRINHGLWHFFVGVSIYFVYHAKEKRKLP